ARAGVRPVGHGRHRSAVCRDDPRAGAGADGGGRDASARRPRASARRLPAPVLPNGGSLVDMVGGMADQPSSNAPSGDPAPAAASPFHSLDEYVALPRVNGLVL